MNKQWCRIAAFAFALTVAEAAQAQVVISQVYGGGGNSGATLRNDFIELRNNGASAVSLAGWSVQYASATNSTWSVTTLTGAIAPGGFYLIQQAAGTGGTTALPTPDTTGTIAMSGTAGKVVLVNNATALSGACPLGGAAVDFVGYGAANCFEGSAPVGALTNSTAALRNGAGSVDTDNNLADFNRAAPDPRNSGAAPPPPPAPPVALTIAQIQGNGLLSPYDKRIVVTEGIVTAGKFNNGFFLQSVINDGDATTSDAILVFTGSAPPASAAVGNRVRITGTVDEFTPSSSPNQLSITELVSPTIELLASNVALPAAIELTVADLGPGALPGTLERLEGMRVSVAQSRVVAPSGGTIDEDDAVSFTDGVFHVVLPAVARPYRETGIGVLDASLRSLPAGKNPPRFDTNQERLMVRSRGQIGAVALSVDTDAQVAGMIGVLDYFSGTWALLPDTATPPIVTGGRLPTAVNDAAYDAVTVASFNVLRFFDEIADGNGAPALKPAALEKRLGKTAGVICDYLKTPDILGIVEVENLRVLGMLADRINSGCARAPLYVPYLQSGNDIGGINVGFLVSTRALADGSARVQVAGVTQIGKDATMVNPDGSTSLLNDRPPLLLRAVVNSGGGTNYPVAVIVNHLRSLGGIDDVASGSSGWATGGERIRNKRGKQAVFLADLVESMQQANPSENIVLVGDFNAFEFNDGYADVLGIIKGDEAAPDQVLTHFASPLTSLLVDGSQLISDPAQRYSYAFAGNAQTLDHVLINQALVNVANGLQVEHARINADFGVDNFGDATVPLYTSDHDPVRLAIRVPSFSSADLSVTASASASSVDAGAKATFNVVVNNGGPGVASFPGVGFALNQELPDLVVSAPAGWACDAPQVTTGRTSVACSAAGLGNGSTVNFSMSATVTAAMVGQKVTLSAAVDAQSLDPVAGNDQASASVTVDAAPDVLTSKVAVTGLSGTAGSSRMYSITVPAGVRLLNLMTYGGSGNVSLYVSRGVKPTTTTFGFRSARPGNNETVRVSSTVAGTYYLLVAGETDYTGLSVQARID